MALHVVYPGLQLIACLISVGGLSFVILLNILSHFYFTFFLFIQNKQRKKMHKNNSTLCSTDRYKVMKVETWCERPRAF